VEVRRARCACGGSAGGAHAAAAPAGTTWPRRARCAAARACRMAAPAGQLSSLSGDHRGREGTLQGRGAAAGGLGGGGGLRAPEAAGHGGGGCGRRPSIDAWLRIASLCETGQRPGDDLVRRQLQEAAAACVSAPPPHHPNAPAARSSAEGGRRLQPRVRLEPVHRVRDLVVPGGEGQVEHHGLEGSAQGRFLRCWGGAALGSRLRPRSSPEAGLTSIPRVLATAA